MNKSLGKISYHKPKSIKKQRRKIFKLPTKNKLYKKKKMTKSNFISGTQIYNSAGTKTEYK